MKFNFNCFFGVLGLVFCFNNSIIGQHKNSFIELHKKTIQFLKAEELDSFSYFKITTLNQAEKKDSLIHWLNLYNKAGRYYWKEKKDYFAALSTFEEMATTMYRSPTSEKEWTKLAWIYANWGKTYLDGFGDIGNAQKYYQKALDIFNHELQREDYQVAWYINSVLATIWTRLGDYPKAIYEAKQVVKFCDDGKHDYQLAASYINLGLAYHWNNDFDLAITTFKKGLAIDKNDYSIQSALHSNLAGSYLGKEDLSNAHQALENNKKLLNKWKQQSGKDESVLTREYQYLNILGKVAAFESDHEKALIAWLKSYSFRTSDIFVANNREWAKLEIQIGQVLLKMDSVHQADNYFNKALERMIPEYDPNANLGLPPSSKLYAENTIAEALLGKAKGFENYYQETNQLDWINPALICYDHFFEVWRQLRAQQEYKAAQLLALSVSKNHIESGLKLAFEAWQNTADYSYLQKAYSLSQKSKNVLLMETIQEKNASILAALPDSIQNKEHDLKHKIVWLEKQIYFQNNNTKEEKDLWQNQLFELKTEQKRFEQSLEADFHEYAGIKNHIPEVSIKQIQDILRADQAVLDYFVGVNEVYVFKIMTDEIDFISIPIDFDLLSAIEIIRGALTDYWLSPISERSKLKYEQLNEQYVNYSHSLFKSLILPLKTLPSELNIIPDEILSYLPFEVLLTSVPKNPNHFKTHPYFGMQYVINYNYNIALWFEMREKNYKHKGWLAVAPEFTEETPLIADISEYRRSNLGYLPWNKGEVEAIQQITGGKTLVAQDATKENFLSDLGQHSIVHLATHAKMQNNNADFSFLAFSAPSAEKSPDKVYLKDIQMLQLPLEMAVLSACETGIGKLEKGEGIFSLSRGFALAGAKSILHSLWAVNDKSTSEIMTAFYQNLDRKHSKDKSLQLAQKNYIDRQIEHRTAHPFYWAAFISTGDNCPIYFGKENAWIWWASAMILGLLLVYFYFKRKNTQQAQVAN